MGRARTHTGAASEPSPKRLRVEPVQLRYEEKDQNDYSAATLAISLPPEPPNPMHPDHPPSAALARTDPPLHSCAEHGQPDAAAAIGFSPESSTLALALLPIAEPASAPALEPDGLASVSPASEHERAGDLAEPRAVLHEPSADGEEASPPADSTEGGQCGHDEPATAGGPSKELREQIRAIASNANLSVADRNRARQQLYMRAYRLAQTSAAAAWRRMLHLQKHRVTWSAHRDPVTGERLRGCAHYARKCKIRAPCCGVWVGCRHCHDHPAVTAEHRIDRFAVREVLCMLCRLEQPVAAHCANPECRVRFARYFCARCNFYDDDPRRDIYHCAKCDICRVGRAGDRDFFHCDACNACVNGGGGGGGAEHRCLPGALDGDCPVCAGCLRTSTAPVVFVRCGHAMHLRCFEQYTAHSYVCPLCSKALTDMRPFYEEIDGVLAAQPLPGEFQARRLEVLCHDCDRRSIAPFHFLYHKCQLCAGYNTRIICERAANEPVRALPAQPGYSAPNGARAEAGRPEEQEQGAAQGELT